MDRRGEKPNRPENFLKSNPHAFLLARILHEASTPLRSDQVVSTARQRMIDETTDIDEITDTELQKTLRSLGRRRIAIYRKPYWSLSEIGYRIVSNVSFEYFTIH